MRPLTHAVAVPGPSACPGHLLCGLKEVRSGRDGRKSLNLTSRWPWEFKLSERVAQDHCDGLAVRRAPRHCIPVHGIDRAHRGLFPSRTPLLSKGRAAAHSAILLLGRTAPAPEQDRRPSDRATRSCEFDRRRPFSACICLNACSGWTSTKHLGPWTECLDLRR